MEYFTTQIELETADLIGYLNNDFTPQEVEDIRIAILQSKCHHRMYEDSCNRKYRCISCGFIIDYKDIRYKLRE